MVQHSAQTNPTPVTRTITQVYAEGYVLGSNAAAQTTATTVPPAVAGVNVAAWAPGVAAGAVGALSVAPGLGFAGLAVLAAGWALEVLRTRLLLITGALAALGVGVTLAAAEHAIRQVLTDPKHNNLIAITELTRGVSAGAIDVYRAAGVTEVRWLTAEDDRVCPLCARNEQAGPRPIGVPFPSGASAPPQHPSCRCALIPA